MPYRDGIGEGKKRDSTNLNLGKMKKTEPFRNKHESCLDFNLTASVRWRDKKIDKYSQEKGMTETVRCD